MLNKAYYLAYGLLYPLCALPESSCLDGAYVWMSGNICLGAPGLKLLPPDRMEGGREERRKRGGGVYRGVDRRWYWRGRRLARRRRGVNEQRRVRKQRIWPFKSQYSAFGGEFGDIRLFFCLVCVIIVTRPCVSATPASPRHRGRLQRREGLHQCHESGFPQPFAGREGGEDRGQGQWKISYSSAGLWGRTSHCNQKKGGKPLDPLCWSRPYADQFA